ncbi:hypothetical protein LOC67_06555 [Stieleria sp. JC731]|uniref:hypothetical protein n=1 Tax=Pirellulaceae TaxID=2691357 RepID=UPI001E480A96|nr:hypothetical protein [Stieleria sp. JC731]MCC9600215.1 hypothetical protein [Stieleria sp. JC731]
MDRFQTKVALQCSGIGNFARMEAMSRMRAAFDAAIDANERRLRTGQKRDSDVVLASWNPNPPSTTGADTGGKIVSLIASATEFEDEAPGIPSAATSVPTSSVSQNCTSSFRTVSKANGQSGKIQSNWFITGDPPKGTNFFQAASGTETGPKRLNHFCDNGLSQTFQVNPFFENDGVAGQQLNLDRVAAFETQLSRTKTDERKQTGVKRLPAATDVDQHGDSDALPFWMLGKHVPVISEPLPPAGYGSARSAAQQRLQSDHRRSEIIEAAPPMNATISPVAWDTMW